MQGVKLTVLAALLALPLAARAADETDQLARVLGDAAVRRNLKRIAVIPFAGPRGGTSYSGAVLSERLVSRLLARGGIEVVERPLLESVLREQKLGLFGIMDPRTAQALGRVLGVDAILSGTAVELRNERVEINARLINAETAQVLAGASAKVEKDWDEPSGADSTAMVVPVPDLPQMSGGSLWRDALNDSEAPEDCAGRETRLEESMMDYKARFWAAKLKDPAFSAKRITKNPGSEIRDPQLRARFYDKMRSLYYAGEAQPLTPLERATLSSGLEELRQLHETCGS
jgi:TolB-like protein